MIDTMVLIGLLALVFVLRLIFESWIHDRKSREVLHLFVKHGATGPDSAVPLKDLGLSLSYWRFGFRDYRSEALRTLVVKKLILQEAKGQFYLSPQGYQAYADRREG